MIDRRSRPDTKITEYDPGVISAAAAAAHCYYCRRYIINYKIYIIYERTDGGEALNLDNR